MSDLRGENEKKKQKRARSRKHLYAESGLSVQEASTLITQPVEAAKPGPGQHSESALQPRTKPPRGCGVCRKPGHRRETCPDR